MADLKTFTLGAVEEGIRRARERAVEVVDRTVEEGLAAARDVAAFAAERPTLGALLERALFAFSRDIVIDRELGPLQDASIEFFCARGSQREHLRERWVEAAGAVLPTGRVRVVLLVLPVPKGDR